MKNKANLFKSRMEKQMRKHSSEKLVTEILGIYGEVSTKVKYPENLECKI